VGRSRRLGVRRATLPGVVGSLLRTPRPLHAGERPDEGVDVLTKAGPCGGSTISQVIQARKPLIPTPLMSATAAARPMVARLPLSWYRKGGARGPAGGRARPALRSALAAWRPAGSRGRCSRSRRGRDHVAEREDVGNGRAGWDPPRLPGAHLLDVPAGGAIGQRGGSVSANGRTPSIAKRLAGSPRR
jgi:hypothetical protein